MTDEAIEPSRNEGLKRTSFDINPQANKERLLLWAEALESAKYAQARRQLAHVDTEGNVTGYCCLGVACEVAIANGLQGLAKVVRAEVVMGHGEVITRGTVVYDDSAGTLPKAVMDWFGFSYTSPAVIDPAVPDDRSIYFTEMNDDLGADFNTIAAVARRAFDLPPKG